MGQNPAMQHVRIGQHHVGALPDGFAGILRGVAIVGEGPDIRAHRVNDGLEFVKLVFGQRLGRKQVHGARAGVFHQTVQDGKVVTKRLTTGRRRDDRGVLAGPDVLESLGLMAVETVQSLLLQSLPELLVDQPGNLRKLAGLRLLVAYGPHGRIRGLHPIPEPGDCGFESLAPRERATGGELRET